MPRGTSRPRDPAGRADVRLGGRLRLQRRRRRCPSRDRPRAARRHSLSFGISLCLRFGPVLSALVVGQQLLAGRIRARLDQLRCVGAEQVVRGRRCRVLRRRSTARIFFLSPSKRCSISSEAPPGGQVGLGRGRLLLRGDLDRVVERRLAGVGGVRALAADVRPPSRRTGAGRSCRPAASRGRRSSTSGRPIEIWSLPARWISGSETPSESVRLRIVSIASSIACGGDRRDLRRRPTLVDQLDAAAQVEAEHASAWSAIT